MVWACKGEKKITNTSRKPMHCETWNEYNLDEQLNTKKCSGCSCLIEPMQSYGIKIHGSKRYKYFCLSCWKLDNGGKNEKN